MWAHEGRVQVRCGRSLAGAEADDPAGGGACPGGGVKDRGVDSAEWLK